MDTLSDTDLGVTAEDFYESQLAYRTGPVNLGRRLADLGSPITFPPEHWQAGDALVKPNQSVNAYAFNTLAAKMMLSAFPPGLPGWKTTPVEHKLDQDIQADPELYGEVLYALSRREETHRARLEATLCRSAYTHYLKLLLYTGNAAVLWTDIDTPIVYNMHNYVVKRDAGGVPLVGVIKVAVSRMVADQDIIDAAVSSKQPKQDSGNPWDEEITLFHVQKLITSENGKKQYVYWQEVEGGSVVEDSVAYADFDKPTIHFGGMIPEYGSNWYIPYGADYEGDMQAVENFSAALQDGGAAAARFLILVNPNGQTEIKDIIEADNLEVVPGREEDVKTLRSDKGGDLQVAAGEMEKAVRRLGQAFLMFSAVQRQGERVTAEEWRILASEIEQAMGGLYSVISQSGQKWFVLRFIHLHEMSDKSIGELPEGLVQISVVTGIDTMGQSSEGTRLDEMMTEAQAAIGPEALAANINVSDYLRRKAAHKNIKADGLVKDAKQVGADQAAMKQDAMQQTLLDKATGPLAKGGADIIGKMLEGGATTEGMTPDVQ